MPSLPLDDRHPPSTSSSASTVHSEQTERSMASTVAAAIPVVTTTSSATDGAKNLSPGASLTLAPLRTTSARASPTPGTTKPPYPHVSTARNLLAAPTATADAPRPLPSSAPAPSGTGSTTSTEGAALTEKLNSTSNGGQLPSPPPSAPTAAIGVVVTAVNVSAPGGGVSNFHGSKSPASGTILVVGGAAPPASTGGSRTAPSPSHHSQRPHPPSSAAEPPPPSFVTNRVPEPMRRPYTTTRYPNLDAALQRISDLEDENYTLQYELDRARAAPPSSSSGVVSAAAIDSVLSAFSLFERESTHLEVRSGDTRENFARALLGLVGHSRGRDRDALSSAMTPAGERDWENNPTNYRHLSHPHHVSQRAQSSPVFLPQSAAPHHVERGHPPPPSSSRHTDQRGYACPASRPSPRPAHDRSRLQQPPVIALPPSNSASSHHGHHSRTGSNTTPSGFDLTRERNAHIDSYSRERASSLAQTGEKRPRAPSFGAEASSSGGRDHREEKRLRVSRDGAWVKRGRVV